MATKTAYLKQIKGITFAGKTDSNHWITMDGPENLVAVMQESARKNYSSGSCRLHGK